VWHPVLAASVERIATESRSWRQAIDSIAPTGRRAILITSDQLDGPFDADLLAETRPLSDDQSHVDVVLVVINLKLLQKLSGLPITARDLKDDLDRIIAHEVYGHAVPLLAAGSLTGNCADPSAGQSAAAACVIQRENVIRREMWLGQRFDYGRESLAIARRIQQH